MRKIYIYDFQSIKYQGGKTNGNKNSQWNFRKLGG